MFFTIFFPLLFSMKNLIYDGVPKSVKLSTGKWVQIAFENESYRLFNPIDELELGFILMNQKEQWIYDGEALTVIETEEIANAIKSHEPEMAALLRTLHDNE